MERAPSADEREGLGEIMSILYPIDRPNVRTNFYKDVDFDRAISIACSLRHERFQKNAMGHVISRLIQRNHHARAEVLLAEYQGLFTEQQVTSYYEMLTESKKKIS